MDSELSRGGRNPATSWRAREASTKAPARLEMGRQTCRGGNLLGCLRQQGGGGGWGFLLGMDPALSFWEAGDSLGPVVIPEPTQAIHLLSLPAPSLPRPYLDAPASPWPTWGPHSCLCLETK